MNINAKSCFLSRRFWPAPGSRRGSQIRLRTVGQLRWWWRIVGQSVWRLTAINLFYGLLRQLGHRIRVADVAQGQALDRSKQKLFHAQVRSSSVMPFPRCHHQARLEVLAILEINASMSQLRRGSI